MKKYGKKVKSWLEKKGNQFAFSCYESNMVDFNHNTWCIDLGSTANVFNNF